MACDPIRPDKQGTSELNVVPYICRDADQNEKQIIKAKSLRDAARHYVALRQTTQEPVPYGVLVERQIDPYWIHDAVMLCTDKAIPITEARYHQNKPTNLRDREGFHKHEDHQYLIHDRDRNIDVRQLNALLPPATLLTRYPDNRIKIHAKESAFYRVNHQSNPPYDLSPVHQNNPFAGRILRPYLCRDMATDAYDLVLQEATELAAHDFVNGFEHRDLDFNRAVWIVEVRLDPQPIFDSIQQSSANPGELLIEEVGDDRWHISSGSATIDYEKLNALLPSPLYPTRQKDETILLWTDRSSAYVKSRHRIVTHDRCPECESDNHDWRTFNDGVDSIRDDPGYWFNPISRQLMKKETCARCGDYRLLKLDP